MAVARDADSVWKNQIAEYCVGRVGGWIVADDAAIAARFETVRRPLVHLVADRRFRKEDPPVVGDVEIVCEPQAAVIINRVQAAVGLIGCLLDMTIGADAVES